MSADIIKQLKSLRSVKPNVEWKKTTRAFLMVETKKEFGGETVVVGGTWASELAKIIFPWKALQLVVRPVLAVFAIFGLVLGSGLSVSASEMALPGDTLYPLKLATEKVHVALTFDKKEKAKIHVELAGRRINEVKKIKETSDTAQNKLQKISVAVSNFREEIAAAGNKIENLKNEVTSEATVEVAKIVDSRASEFEEALTATTADFSVEGETAENISQGLSAMDEAGDKALAVIVEKHMQGEVVQPEEEVLKRVENKIETTEAKVAQVEDQITGLSVTDGSEAHEVAAQAKEALVLAREALNQKDMTVALSKTMESKELAKQAEQIVTEVSSVATVSESVSCEECNINADNLNSNTNTDLMNTETETTNINADTNTNSVTNTNTVKVYVRPVPVKVVVPPPPVEPVIDESTLKVGIDLKQEPTEE